MQGENNDPFPNMFTPQSLEHGTILPYMTKGTADVIKVLDLEIRRLSWKVWISQT